MKYLADFEEMVARLIGNALEHHSPEEILEYLNHQRDCLEEYGEEYPEKMKLDKIEVEIREPEGGEKIWERVGVANSE